MLHPQMICREGVATEITLERFQLKVHGVNVPVELPVAVEKLTTVGTLLAAAATCKMGSENETNCRFSHSEC